MSGITPLQAPIDRDCRPICVTCGVGILKIEYRNGSGTLILNSQQIDNWFVNRINRTIKITGVSGSEWSPMVIDWTIPGFKIDGVVADSWTSDQVSEWLCAWANGELPVPPVATAKAGGIPYLSTITDATGISYQPASPVKDVEVVVDDPIMCHYVRIKITCAGGLSGGCYILDTSIGQAKQLITDNVPGVIEVKVEVVDYDENNPDIKSWVVIDPVNDIKVVINGR